MSDRDTLRSLENTAYQRAYSDGVLDLFVGLSLVWIGSVWILLPEYGGLAGILPAVFTPTAIALRKSFVENRTGYVRWSEPRRNREQRRLGAVIAAGVLLFFAGVIAYFVFDRTLADEDVLDFLGPGILAWLLALLTFLLAFVLDAWRFLVYAAVLGVAGLVAAMTSANPGMPLLAGGAAIAITGVVMVTRFVRLNPRDES